MHTTDTFVHWTRCKLSDATTCTLTYDRQLVVVGQLRVDGRLRRYLAAVDAGCFEVHISELDLSFGTLFPLQSNVNHTVSLKHHIAH